MIALYLVLFIGLFFFLLKMGVRYASQLTRRVVEKRFRAAETLVNGRRIPEAWITKLRLSEVTAETGLSGDSGKAKKKLISWLDSLTKFFETSPFFESEETRELMVGRLDEVYQDWQEKSLAEILTVYRTKETADG